MKIFLITAPIVLFSCATPQTAQESSPRTSSEILRTVEARNLESLYTAFGTISANADIMLVSQGGPEFESSFTAGDRIPQDPAYVRVLAKQEQMIRKANGRIPTDRLISDEEANEINMYSAAILYALAKDFQAKGHNVILYAFSFGSYVAAKMLQYYSDEPFTKIFITVARLDMPLEFVNSLFDLRGKRFSSDGKTIIDAGNVDDFMNRLKNTPDFCSFAAMDPLPDDKKVIAYFAKEICTGNTVDREKEIALGFILQSGMILLANISGNRYTEILKDRDLSKITYYFGGKDRAVGRLTNAEVRFLTGKEGFDIDNPPASVDWYRTQNFTEARDEGSPPQNFTMHIIKGAPKRATVKYDLDAGHSHLKEEIKKDIVASF